MPDVMIVLPEEESDLAWRLEQILAGRMAKPVSGRLVVQVDAGRLREALLPEGFVNA